MSKELPYFKFYPSEWLLGDISDETLQMQGAFIRVCCLYWLANGSITYAKLQRKLHKTTLKSLQNKGYIKVQNDSVLISFLDEQHRQLSYLQASRVKAGKLGAKQRYSSAKAKHSNIDIDKDKDKDKDIDIENAITDVLKHLNEVCNRKFSIESESHRKFIRARLKDFTAVQLQEVIELKYFEWRGTEAEKYLRPKTLFNKEKCELYIDEVVNAKNNPNLYKNANNKNDTRRAANIEAAKQAAEKLTGNS